MQGFTFDFFRCFTLFEFILVTNLFPFQSLHSCFIKVLDVCLQYQKFLSHQEICSKLSTKTLKFLNITLDLFEVNPFLANVLVLYSLKTPENALETPERGYKMGSVARNGLITSFRFFVFNFKHPQLVNVFISKFEQVLAGVMAKFN